jgi:hypothetical protein
MKLTALNRLIGLEVVAVKGFREDARKRVEASYILMSDKETVITLEEQDYHAYHDCSPSARYIQVASNPEFWKQVMNSYPDATDDSFIG